MTGFLAFRDRCADEQACIAALASVRWPDGFVCAACDGRRSYQLRARPRVFECAGCGRQHSVTADTVFHRTKTPLRKWFFGGLLAGPRQARRLGDVSRPRVGIALRDRLADRP